MIGEGRAPNQQCAEGESRDQILFHIESPIRSWGPDAASPVPIHTEHGPGADSAGSRFRAVFFLGFLAFSGICVRTSFPRSLQGGERQRSDGPEIYQRLWRGSLTYVKSIGLPPVRKPTLFRIGTIRG